ncbi:MAG: hypothetical protein WCF85_01805 [Rhodospirillaceae bacterium]
MSASKLSRLVVKLDRETTNEHVSWAAKPPPADLTRATDDVIKQVCETRYNDVWIRVFEKRTRTFDEDDEKFYWRSDFVLQFIDGEGNVEWEESNITGLRELLETITYKTHKISKKIDAILAA